MNTVGDTLKALLAVAAETRRRLLRPPARSGPVHWWEYLGNATDILDVAEGEVAEVLARAQVTGYADATAALFRAATGSPAPVPVPRLARIDAPVQLVGPVEGAAALRASIPYLREQYDLLADDAKRVGFTVARAATETVVERVRDVVADAVQNGKLYRDVRQDLRKALDTTPLSEPQAKTIFRTYVGRAQAAGQLATLDHPVVRDEFPYLMYSATHDSRVRKEHLAFDVTVKEYPGSPWGLNGTNVYRSDDPIWDEFFPPWSWSCRCLVVPISREVAASMGVAEAVKWVETGRPPAIPQYVKPPPYGTPKGWVPTGRRLVAA